MSSNKQIVFQNGEQKIIFFFFFNKTQMFEFYHYSNFGNVCVELKMLLPTDFAADFRYRSQSLFLLDKTITSMARTRTSVISEDKIRVQEGY